MIETSAWSTPTHYQVVYSRLQGTEIEDWLTDGKTYLVMKIPTKRSAPGNYWPITCLTIFEIANGGLVYGVQQQLNENKLFSILVEILLKQQRRKRSAPDRFFFLFWKTASRERTTLI